MRITFRANTPRDRVNERSSLVVTIKTWDDSLPDEWTAQVPTNLYYRLDNLNTGAVVLDWTSITADDETSLTVTPDQNAITDTCRAFQTMQISVAADYGLSTQCINDFRYQIKNLQGVT